MADEKPAEPTSIFSLILTIVRENGLITLALLVLVWTVYFQGTVAQEQNDQWRETLKDVTAELTAMREARMSAWHEIAESLGKLEATMLTLQTLTASVEEACKLEPK